MLLALLLTPPLYPVSDPAESSFMELKKHFNVMNGDEFEREGSLFLKKYPGSSRVPDVRLMLAEKESDTELAVEKYRSIVKNYPGFPKREYALHRLCQVLDLKSKWKDLRAESAAGIRLFPAGDYLNDFRFMHITAALMLEDYDTARDEAFNITEHTHDFETLSRAISLLAEAEKRRGGNSKSYIYNLRELAAGFDKSELYPSMIYRLGLFYEEKKDYNRAFSAYSDIAEYFPASPEADMAVERIKGLKRYNPEKTAYMPDNTTVDKTEELDLSPEQDIKKELDENYYSVAVGPYTRIGDTAGIMKLLKNYEGIRRVKTSYGYTIYIGKYDTPDTALETRIRLAEEYGINGQIVRFSVQGKKSYIYEDR